LGGDSGTYSGQIKEAKTRGMALQVTCNTVLPVCAQSMQSFDDGLCVIYAWALRSQGQAISMQIARFLLSLAYLSQDGGDPAVDVSPRDIVYTLSADTAAAIVTPDSGNSRSNDYGMVRVGRVGLSDRQKVTVWFRFAFGLG
jgi:hypothetical protein